MTYQNDDANLSAEQLADTKGEPVEASPAATPNPPSKSVIRPIASTGASADTPKAKIKPVSNVVALAKSAKKNAAAEMGKRVQATFPLLKPMKSKYVRVHPSGDYRLKNVLTFTDTDTAEIYYVSPDLELPEYIQGQVRVTNLYAAVTHDDTFFIWFVHHSDTSWFRAAQTAIRTATGNWTRVVARKAANTYDLYKPEGALPEPDWTALPTFMEMVENGFEDRLITTLEHPLLRKLRGHVNDEE